MKRSMPDVNLKIVPVTKDKDYGDGFVVAEKRYIIVDTNGTVADDAQGYGYKSQQTAYKAMWYKFKGGKDRIATVNASGKRYWSTKKRLADAITERIECAFKEMARGETTIEDIVSQVEKDFSVSLDRRMVNWLMQQ